MDLFISLLAWLAPTIATINPSGDLEPLATYGRHLYRGHYGSQLAMEGKDNEEFEKNIPTDDGHIIIGDRRMLSDVKRTGCDRQR